MVSARTGTGLTTYQFTSQPSFVNDVVLTSSAAWFTDSRQAQLYRVPLTRTGPPASASRVRTLALTGDWVQTPGVNNANGITNTPDRRALLVVQSNTGFLFRVNPRTGRATRVQLRGRQLANGDGLLRRGRLLYVVQHRLNLVTVLRLDRAGTRGRLLVQLTTPEFDVPTTIAASGRTCTCPTPASARRRRPTRRTGSRGSPACRWRCGHWPTPSGRREALSWL